MTPAKSQNEPMKNIEAVFLTILNSRDIGWVALGYEFLHDIVNTF